MTTLQQTITKESIQQMEVEDYKGNLVLIDTEEAAAQAIAQLMTRAVVGFDTETRPSFQKGKSYLVSLIQLSTEDTCYLFRLQAMGLCSALVAFFESESVCKVGLSLRDDIGALRKRAAVDPKNCIDLQDYVKPFGIEEASLQKIYAILFNKKISKSKRLTNWDAEELTEAQQQYAALDAWACLRIYEKLNNLPL